MLIASNYNMYNVKKTVIHIPKLRVGQYLLLFDINYYLKISPICSKFLMWKRTLLWQKKRKFKKKTKNLKIRFQQRRVKPKCSTDKKSKQLLPTPYQFHYRNLNFGMYFYVSALISRNKFALVNLFLIP